jgi:hypothetical protein
VGALSLLVAGSFFVQYEICEPAAHRYFKECAEHNVPYIVATFFDGHNGSVSAIAAVFIAGFTLTLWLVSRRQADLIERTLIVGERAFVFVERINPLWEPISSSGDFSFTFRPMWKNSGHTQTRRMKTRVNSEFRDTPLPEDFDFRGALAAEAPALLGPGAVITGGFDRSYTSTDLDEIKDRKKYLYVWGWTEYNDIFPNTPKHITRYCSQVKVFGDTRQPKAAADVFNIIFVHHPTGNCSDDDCSS